MTFFELEAHTIRMDEQDT